MKIDFGLVVYIERKLLCCDRQALPFPDYLFKVDNSRFSAKVNFETLTDFDHKHSA